MTKRKDSVKGGKLGVSSSFRRRSSSSNFSTTVVRPPLFPSVDVAFKTLLSARICAAIWSHISDCDETYNYWEPLHYLLYNKGLQTWEYSPEFALRSYTYLLIHGVPAYIYKQIFEPNPMLIFYFIRLLLGLGCAVAEVYFYKGVCREFGVHIGRAWLVFQLFSAGMFISSAALLPSSFSMYFTMSALSAWWHQKYKLAIFFTAISVLLGWPFVGLISLPIVYDIIVRRRKVRTFVFWSIISGVTILLPMILIDSSYYGSRVMAPINIVLYNVFSSKGPDLYGTEPFSYYIFNGFLNYNIIWLLSLLTPIALLIGYLAIPAKTKQPTLSLPYYVSLSPFYLWLAVMMVQSHKEERFLFPVYPLVSLCGAITIDVCQRIFFRLKSAVVKFTTPTHYLNHTTFITVIVVIMSVLFNLSRIMALYRNYHAPMDIFMEFSTSRDILEDSNAKKIDVCIGKDWYRYPNSFFFPSTKYSIRFLKSEFRGMLPAYYSHEENATQIIHNYFNDMNQENPYMYFNYDYCDFLVDFDSKSKKVSSDLEPNYSLKTKEWKKIREVPFLNPQASHPIYRAFYIPFVSYKHIKYGSFNLLQKITPPIKAHVKSVN